MEIQARTPSETSLPRRTYWRKGSMEAASSARMLSALLRVTSWVLVE